MSRALPILLEYISGQNWAMQPSTLQQMVDIVERHVRGDRISDDEIKDITAARTIKGSDKRTFEITDGGMAVIPVSGIIAKYSRLVNGSSKPRGTSIETLRGQFDEAMTDARVKGIFLHIESPGGNLDGLADFAEDIYSASFEKPITAYADDLAASAAYWLGSQANAFYANQTADVGSIGVYTLYVDSSARAEQLGLKFHIVRSGPNKRVGSAGVEITEENLAAIQTRIDTFYDIFIAAVLRGRGRAGLTEENLRELADGRTYIGADAAEKKLIDGVYSLAAAFAAGPPRLRDSHTTVATVASVGKNNNRKNKEINMSNEQTQDGAAVVNGDEIKEAATAAERQRIASISSALDGEAFSGVRNKAIAEGKSLTEAKAIAFDAAVKIHGEQLADIKQELAVAEQKLTAIAAGGSDVAAQPANDADQEQGDVTGDDDGKAETYEKMVTHLQTEAGGKLSKGKAGIEAAKKFPRSHEAWKEAQPMIGG